MQKAEKRLLGILRRAKAVGIPNSVITDVFNKVVRKQPTLANGTILFVAMNRLYGNRKSRSVSLGLAALVAYLTTQLYFGGNSECLIDMPFDATKVFRRPENCAMCHGVQQVDRVTNISQDDFDYLYASVARPVIITDATRDWAAHQVFSFDFFKELYKDAHRGSSCQFFPYQTEFGSLHDALMMDANRSRLEVNTPPWYIGWSNCNDVAGKILRRHYDRPYFLANTSENMALSWIFMGGPGDGAHMHVDNVHYPSWQAQIRGKKKWRLAPPPECYYECDEFSAIVAPGEILVVDTNRWYHQTTILPGDISITIGTEFD